MPRVRREIARPNRWKLLARRQPAQYPPGRVGGVGLRAGHGRCDSRALRADWRHGRVAGATFWRVRSICACRKSGSMVGRTRRSRCCGRHWASARVIPYWAFPSKARASVSRSLSWVEHVAVERRLPGTIYVDAHRTPSVRHLAVSRQIPVDRPRRRGGHQRGCGELHRPAAGGGAGRARACRRHARRLGRSARYPRQGRRHRARRRAALEPAAEEQRDCHAAGGARGAPRCRV